MAQRDRSRLTLAVDPALLEERERKGSLADDQSETRDLGIPKHPIALVAAIRHARPMEQVRIFRDFAFQVAIQAAGFSCHLAAWGWFVHGQYCNGKARK
ncbi:MAG: hypothetical protein ACRECV_02020 [Xanthobacteraceae bacterium]